MADPEDGEKPDDKVELLEPEDFGPPNPFPIDARALGIDRYSGDAALIGAVANFDSTKVFHRVLAWVLLLALVAPLALGVLGLLGS